MKYLGDKDRAFTFIRNSVSTMVALFSLCFLGATSTIAGEGVSLVSVNQKGAISGNNASLRPRLSPDGRFVVFISYATDLVPNVGTGRRNVFLRDLMSSETVLVSVDTGGSNGANDDCFDAYVSANGRYVLFASAASNLVPNDQNGLPDLFMRDLVTKTTKLVSINRAGTGSGNGLTFNTADLAMTPDGRFVVFFSAAGDLVDGDTNNAMDLFVRDMVEEKTSLVSIDMAGNAAGLGATFSPSISTNGRFITFESSANNLVSNDPARGGGVESDIFVRDMVAGVTTLISVNSLGTASGNGASRFATSTPDGRFIVFQSSATNLVANDTNVYWDVYVRDRVDGTTTLVSVNKEGKTGTSPGNVMGPPAISADGRFVVFASIADDLVVGDTNRRVDVFARDLRAGTTTILSRNRTGTNGGDDDSQNPLISADGRFVIFQSLASNLTPTTDANAVTDIFAHDLKTGVTELVSLNSAAAASGNNISLEATISADGRSIAFSSDASDLVADDTNNATDIFIRQGARVQFSSGSYNVAESSGHGDIVVTRTGDLSIPVSVDYTTNDQAGLRPCQTSSDGLASERCDYVTSAGTLRFGVGEKTKVIPLVLINDAYVEGQESLSILLSNPSEIGLGWRDSATVTITDDDTQPGTTNPIDDQAFFIRQQYVDFLGREPEQAGFNFWMERMTHCPAGQVCDRTDTSQRFFQSDEFQERGFYVYKLYDAVLGRLPMYTEFVPEVARLNGFQTPAEQRERKDVYLLNFIDRQEFKALYGQYLTQNGLTVRDPVGFVNALCAKAAITPSIRQTLISNLQNGTRDTAHTVEDFILAKELSDIGSKFYDRGFIVMQYFGYLKRDPESAGFDFWSQQLLGPNAPHHLDYRFMVSGFLNSDEYRFRFAFIPAR